MWRVATSLALVLGLAGWVSIAAAGPDCAGCKTIKTTSFGFCDHCSKGMIYGHEVKSQQLVKAMEGEKADPAKMKCPGCTTALKENGVCDHCKVGVADGKVYHSMTAYYLASGKPITEEAIKTMGCGDCTKAYKENGFCSPCNMGIVDQRVFAEKEAYEHALAAHNILMAALQAAPKCETCAVAIVTDGTCEKCKATYKDGKKS